jgi:hypothetical protein
MPLLNSLTKIAVKPLPRMFSPRAHAIIDYITVGSFLMSSVSFWRQNKRAAVAALVCATSDLAVSLLTDYPGGIRKVISLGTHSQIDLGLGAMTATMPEFLAFKHENERKFFLAQGVLITAMSELTEVGRKQQYLEKGSRRKAA